MVQNELAEGIVEFRLWGGGMQDRILMAETQAGFSLKPACPG